MRNHNDKNNSLMWWMILLCALPLIILLLAGRNLFSQGRYLWPILIGGFMVAHFWIMLRSHRSHDSDHAASGDKRENQKSHGGLWDGCKTIPATILSFRLRLRPTSQNAFHHSWAMAQTFLLVFLASLENLKFRYGIVLQPSPCH